MMHALTTALAALSLLTTVHSHGHIMSVIANSATYTAVLPVKTPDFTADAPSISRKVNGDGPVQAIASNDMTCNIGAVPILNSDGTSRTGTITAGTNLTWIWSGFTHSGPMFTYMAKCDPDCGHFTGSSGKVWFKIDEWGYQGKWGTQQMFDQGNKWYSTIPACLPDGEYLLRHETINLGSCATVGSCQFYPTCEQVKVVGGKGTKTPSSSELVAFPGAYDPNDPKIKWNSNLQDPATYKTPGPTVFKC